MLWYMVAWIQLVRGWTVLQFAAAWVSESRERVKKQN